MRSPDQVFEDIELDREQREREIRIIENFAARSEEEYEKKALRRSIVILTYAHLEGFCKFALSAYAGAVNSRRLPCKDAVVPLVAATLTRTFAALRDVNHKHPVFKQSLPEDRDVHLVWREQTFVEKYEEISASFVEIPDRAIDTKSNLDSIVLKRNLYRLGLPYPVVDAHSDKINELLGRRNAIAHGDIMISPSEAETKKYTDAAFAVMSFIQNEIDQALRTETYRRSAA